MPMDLADVRTVVERACARQDVLDACRKRDLGTVIEILGHHGLTQGTMASVTGITQGRLSEYKNHKITPKAKAIFEDFANGLQMPSTARMALGLSSDQSANARARTSQSSMPSDVGLAYPDAPAEAADNVSLLWREDLESSQLLDAALEPDAWDDASLRWLVDPGQSPSRGSANGARIGKADVARFRATVEVFSQLDVSCPAFSGQGNCG